jgi:hypothetical protein
VALESSAVGAWLGACSESSSDEVTLETADVAAVAVCEGVLAVPTATAPVTSAPSAAASAVRWVSLWRRAARLLLGVEAMRRILTALPLRHVWPG